ncbi:DNA-binding transcriptional regulator, AcrR family [Amycolatopsis xylanica]|uniref:DNA-binding transcriptional regulator, AcrR family n=1 Tax=Amycolatopsis xylanica TaxID=589385 RepID=A0A1H3GSA7_9PSEU|nr:TetR/AcrR family transcriptional regulator [Amycolatopsis xylanica]SDY05209.1 DNA-binding transcriptional regulator, AcrR family [Amycolatopsis xylanica]
MMSFQRAHSPEQREERRRVILDTASSMLNEMPVAEITLNELSRRVGLAKSNVLRYFESREAILLELATAALAEFNIQAESALASIDPNAPVLERGDQVASALTDCLAASPMLCELVSTQASVLERNISTEAVLRYKRDSIRNFEALAVLILRRLPELGEDGVTKFGAAAMLMTGAIWTHAHPVPAILAAYEADPALAIYKLDFTSTLRETLQVIITGLLARKGS